MTKELSALLDDELESHEEAALWTSLRAAPELRRTWQDYRLIGDAMRNESGLEFDITQQVMAELVDEPVVFAPINRTPRRNVQSALWAVAASAAGVAVVAWVALMPAGNESSVKPALAANDVKMQVLVAAPTVGPANGSAAMQEYVLAHQTNARGYFPGGAQHIRTVSVVNSAK